MEVGASGTVEHSHRWIAMGARFHLCARRAVSGEPAFAHGRRLSLRSEGLDSLFPEQQQAWQQWLARFALAWALPPDGMKSGEKWKSEQAEPSSTPIAGLQWARDSIYVRDEPCQASQLSLMGDVSPSDRKVWIPSFPSSSKHGSNG